MAAPVRRPFPVPPRYFRWHSPEFSLESPESYRMMHIHACFHLKYDPDKYKIVLLCTPSCRYVRCSRSVFLLPETKQDSLLSCQKKRQSRSIESEVLHNIRSVFFSINLLALSLCFFCQVWINPNRWNGSIFIAFRNTSAILFPYHIIVPFKRL